MATDTSSGNRSFLSGLTATIALQSSTATALMTTSFVERELIKPRMAQIVLLGANVGTAVTAWIVATGIEWLALLVILVGTVLYRNGSAARQGEWCRADRHRSDVTFASSVEQRYRADPQSPALAAFIDLLNNAWPVLLAVAAAIAFISSSILAAVVLILSLALTGVLSAGLNILLVLGANLGGAIPPVAVDAAPNGSAH